ncbi:phosphate ABC transporter substrate-binding protein PstS [Streptomonospora nanhaiensis]|uniref:Phosphate-binding protein n=1 Tax=Streptomonospora nanhaiensis TaxID=1323731 RepID=A0A853BPG0_9ACTN|nr:phosphate ABC transporter substrate-binding protein PstS [Streptomonospora nanhaiensis]MBV2365959.1 phosphate ABC transporter substrate-binding protein PstS [Streptomonospora nanhaiensis]MBX9388863.1 phosphate ABC transporter substrate-binding protein PstS [Streptomonospora nanhaiensis]NYI96605.1 phosphate transport system substrate-binding protein [Streptomonospora nanhaiensis]
MKLSKYGQFAGIALAGTLALSACGSDNPTGNGGDGSAAPQAGDVECVDGGGTLSGAGASSQENAMAAWKAVWEGACEGSVVEYDAVGSGAGRSQFIEGGVAFAGSDAALDEAETEDATERCNGSEVVNLPAYIAPIAVAFNLEGVDSLNLTPEVIADIFNQEITNWNDDAIAEENPDVELPDQEIVPVNRSDESGTTENFVAYLAEAAPDNWPHEVSGNWPIDPVEAAQGSSGVVNAIEGGEGTIGYVDASHVGELGTVAVGVGEEFVEYSPEAAAAIVDASQPREENTENDHAIDLDYTTDEAGVYPIVLVSYHVACMEYEEQAEADLVKSFLSYVVSEEGQQAAADEAGAAPLSQETRDALTGTIEQISAAS